MSIQPNKGDEPGLSVAFNPPGPGICMSMKVISNRSLFAIETATPPVPDHKVESKAIESLLQSFTVSCRAGGF